MNRRVIIIICFLFFAIIGSVYFIIHSFKKKVFITGFAYKNDLLEIKQSTLNSQDIIVDTPYYNQKRICLINNNFNYYNFGHNKLTLNIKIDSAHHILLDTLIIISEKNKKPAISFEDPTETKFKRRLFVVDEDGVPHPN